MHQSIRCVAILLFHCIIMTSSFQSESPPTTHPWWENPNLPWEAVDEDFSWNKRRTGVSPTWTSGLGQWSHYKAEDLECSNPVPWTRGRMCKFLRLVDDNAFQLHSVYEKEALGLWLAGIVAERPDGNYDHNYTFTKSPYRIQQNMLSNLPPDMMTSSKAAMVSQATIVQPDAATYAGIRFLPTVEQAQRLLQGKDHYARAQYAELWLAETVEGRPEGRKIGLFCQYDGCTGELKQFFRTREVAVPNELAPPSPTGPIHLAQLERTLVQARYTPWVSDAHLSTPACRALLQGKPLSYVIRKGTWRSMSSRVVTIPEGVIGNEVACQVALDAVEPEAYSSPADHTPSLFWDCRFEDGVYARIPKTFHPDALDDTTPVTLELGSITLSGQFHRLLAVGSRREGGFKTAVYEKWS
jgi:hypothetical protein